MARLRLRKFLRYGRLEPFGHEAERCVYVSLTLEKAPRALVQLEFCKLREVLGTFRAIH